LERLVNVGLEELHSGGQFWYSHKTDLYRVWILERFGGVYLDTDVILQKPIKTSVFGQRVLGLEQGSLQPEKSHEAVVVNSMHVQSLDDDGVYESTHGHCYDRIVSAPDAAAVMLLEPGAPFARRCMRLIARRYRFTVWGSVGPRVRPPRMNCGIRPARALS